MVVGRFLWSPCSIPWFSSLVFCTLSGEGITCSLQRWGWRGHAVSISLSFAHSAGWNLVPVRPEGTYTESLGKIQLTTSLASLKKQKQQNTRTPLCKECHHLCSHLVLLETFGRDSSPAALTGSVALRSPGHLRLLLHKGIHSPCPQLQWIASKRSWK